MKGYKKCKKCWRQRQFSSFKIDVHQKDGRQDICMECHFDSKLDEAECRLSPDTQTWKERP